MIPRMHSARARRLIGDIENEMRDHGVVCSAATTAARRSREMWESVRRRDGKYPFSALPATLDWHGVFGIIDRTHEAGDIENTWIELLVRTTRIIGAPSGTPEQSAADP
jgi:hypothetical protein